MAIAGLFWIRSLPPDPHEPAVRIADVSSERLLASGGVVGFAAAHETHAWMGIPYARPPVAELRWRGPRDPEAWGDTLDALAPGSPCPQPTSLLSGFRTEGDAGFVGDEDCLYLNVWAPRADLDAVPRGSDRLPVLVWIHGGGNRVGQGSAPMYDGARLAGDENVVVVTFNYRLGPFGWFSHPALRAEAADAEEASGNFGTLDQIQVLRWVQDHIAEFGGDPDNVTIFGESAGGRNVLALLLAPAAEGLFHRAIAQSGSTDAVSRFAAENPVDAQPAGHRHSSAEIVTRLLAETGIVPDRAGARRYAETSTAADLREFLRDRAARDVLEAYRVPDDLVGIDLPILIRDGVLLPAGDWIEAFRDGHFHRVPVMLGSNRDEMKVFLSQDPTLVRRRFGIFYRILDPEEYERRSRRESDLWAARAVERPAAALVDAGHDEVYVYRFDWDEESRWLGSDFSTLLGASHAFELPFLFGTFDLGSPRLNRVVFSSDTQDSRERLGTIMRAYWAEFARTGRPGRGGRESLRLWLPWVDGARASTPMAQVMLLDSDAGGGVRMVDLGAGREQAIAIDDRRGSADGIRERL